MRIMDMDQIELVLLQRGPQAFWPRIPQFPAPARTACIKLQRGPGLLAQDTRFSGCWRGKDNGASKRPRPFGPGYASVHSLLPLIRNASKRPRPFGPGYINWRTHAFFSYVWLQRGPGYLSAVETKTPFYATLQRGPGLLAQDTLSGHGFLIPQLNASKRPRPFGPGYQFHGLQD